MQKAEGRRQKAEGCRSAFSIQRLAFTLVEMLVVITIIGILASLVTVGAYSAIEAAKKARMRAEMNSLQMALDAYKAKYGEYPPSILGGYLVDPYGVAPPIQASDSRHPVYRHLAKAFPRCNPLLEAEYIPRANGASQAANNYDANMPPMSQAHALVFWLTSISKDPARPLSAVTTDRQSFFDFDQSRIKTNTSLTAPSPLPSGWQQSVAGWQRVTVGSVDKAIYNPPAYFPQDGGAAPYVYYEARTYLDHQLDLGPATDRAQYQTTALSATSDGGGGVCLPYFSDLADKNKDGQLNDTATYTEWDTVDDGVMSRTEYQALCVNPKSFQLICAGLDGSFGDQNSPIQIPGYSGSNPPPANLKVKSYPSGNGYSAEDDDNLTSFAERPLGDAKP